MSQKISHRTFFSLGLAASLLACQTTPSANPLTRPKHEINTATNTVQNKTAKEVVTDFSQEAQGSETGVSITVKINTRQFKLQQETVTSAGSFDLFLTREPLDPFKEEATVSTEEKKILVSSTEVDETGVLSVRFDNVPLGGPYTAMVSLTEETQDESITTQTLTQADKEKDWSFSSNTVVITADGTSEFSDGGEQLRVDSIPNVFGEVVISNETEEKKEEQAAEKETAQGVIFIPENDPETGQPEAAPLENIPVNVEFIPANLIVRVNDDDDDLNNGIDLKQNPNAKENDLLPLAPAVEDTELIITKVTPADRIALWKSPDKAEVYKLGEIAKTVYVEGLSVSKGLGDIQLEYALKGKDEGEANLVKITVIGVQETLFDSPGKLSDDPNFKPRSASLQGKRIFAGRDPLVTSKVIIQPRLDKVPVYLNLVDVDDPNDHGNEVDPEKQVEDNRDVRGKGEETWLSSRSRQVTVSTQSDGEALSTFAMPKQPGDNLRVVASLDPVHRPSGRTTDKDADSYFGFNQGLRIASVPNFPGATQAKASRLLTTWRKLTVNALYMSPPTKIGENDEVNVTVTSVNGAKIMFTPALSDLAFYEGGQLVCGKVVYGIIGLSANELSVGTLGGTLALPAKGAACYIKDDDNTSLLTSAPADLKAALPKINAFYNETYIDVSIKEVGTGPIPFVKNFGGFLGTSQNTYISDTHGTHFQGIPNSEDFWNTQIIMAFQGNTGEDLDPKNEEASYGNTDPQLGTSLIFLETIRDSSFKTLGEIVAHETGHNFKHFSTGFGAFKANNDDCGKAQAKPHSLGSGGHTNEGLMRAGACNLPFSPFSQDLVRDTVKPRE